MVTAEAADGTAAVRQLVLIASYLPEPGQSLSSFAGNEPAPFLAVDPGTGTFRVVPEALVDTFLHDCPPDIATEAGRHLAAQSLSVVQHPVRAAAWHRVPSTYVVCRGDRGTPVERQREFARRATRVVELDTGHHPFLARPDAVADLVAGLS